MKIYYASAGGFGGPQFGYFFKKERARAELIKAFPTARGHDNDWQWDHVRNAHYLRVDDVTLTIREYEIQ